jgi:hypothetical protein
MKLTMMNSIEMILTILLFCLVLRHLLVLKSVYRSYRFLNKYLLKSKSIDNKTSRPLFYIILPVLREAAIIRQTLDHFKTLIKGHNARIVVVTTTREDFESKQYEEFGNTITIVEELAKTEMFIHLHYPNPEGIKADQLNYAANYLISSKTNDKTISNSFFICYDADSRPPFDSLTCFENIISEYTDVNIFHQSSRFEVCQIENSKKSILSWLKNVIVSSGALRANRFVLAYEIPRLLNRSILSGYLKRKVCSYVFSHVTGHGLCIRLSFLKHLPFPSRSPLEDMHYSFILGSRNEPIMPITNLDCAEVPVVLHDQVEQAARWFLGPSRFFNYLRNLESTQNLRARLLCVSCIVICIEWISCAIMPMLLILLLWYSSMLIGALVLTFIIVYSLQLIAVELCIGSPIKMLDKVSRFILYPINCMLFGIGGIIGSIRLIRGTSTTSKTERCNIKGNPC